jgi:hypothetical protein
MARAVRPGQIFNYVLEEDRKLPEEEQTVWYLAQPSLAENHALENMVSSVDMRTQKLSSDTGGVILDTLRCCLKGWKRFRIWDPKEKELVDVEFVTTKRHILGGPLKEIPNDKTLEHIHPDHRRELADAVSDHTALTEDDEKNLQ